MHNVRAILKVGQSKPPPVLMALYLLHTYILLNTIATFQKAGTCLEAQQSMAKQPIKGCVSNQSHMRRKCERKIRINLKALEETSMLDNIKNFG